MRFRKLGQLEQARGQRPLEARLAAGLEAGIECGQLHRDAWARHQRLEARVSGWSDGMADRLDGREIPVEIMLRVGVRLRRLAEHVVGEAVAVLLVLRRS